MTHGPPHGKACHTIVSWLIIQYRHNSCLIFNQNKPLWGSNNRLTFHEKFQHTFQWINMASKINMVYYENHEDITVLLKHLNSEFHSTSFSHLMHPIVATCEDCSILCVFWRKLTLLKWDHMAITLSVSHNKFYHSYTPILILFF